MTTFNFFGISIKKFNELTFQCCQCFTRRENRKQCRKQKFRSSHADFLSVCFQLYDRKEVCFKKNCRPLVPTTENPC